MARKSRKTYRENLYQQEQIAAPQRIPTVLYCRLSKADEITGRESMDSQRSILRQYAEAHDDLEIVEEFLDDGFTGTNYHRPQFEIMMDGVRDGKYKCIVVKDLSRLGRSYLETSDLLEMELPLYDCRFISVNDHIDTANCQIDTILVGLKNIMNQKFAEDISKKIKADFRERAKKGETLGGLVPYGYVRDPENPGYLIVDEEAAAVVRHIFELKISGLNDVALANRLNEEGILSPRQYHDLKVKGVEPEGEPYWRPDTVRNITLNESYLGHVIHGKFKEKVFIGQADSKTRRSQWTIYKNINPPIVTQEVFDEAKKVREQLYRGEIKRWKTRKS